MDERAIKARLIFYIISPQLGVAWNNGAMHPEARTIPLLKEILKSLIIFSPACIDFRSHSAFILAAYLHIFSKQMWYAVRNGRCLCQMCFWPSSQSPKVGGLLLAIQLAIDLTKFSRSSSRYVLLCNILYTCPLIRTSYRMERAWQSRCNLSKRMSA